MICKIIPENIKVLENSRKCYPHCPCAKNNVMLVLPKYPARVATCHVQHTCSAQPQTIARPGPGANDPSTSKHHVPNCCNPVKWIMNNGKITLSNNFICYRQFRAFETCLLHVVGEGGGLRGAGSL